MSICFAMRHGLVKKLSILLAMVFITISLGACGSSNTGTDKNSSNGATQSEDSSNGKDAGKDALRLPDIKLDNKVVNMMTNADPQNDPNFQAVIDGFKEAYGGEVKINLVVFEEMATKLASLVMSGESPDLYAFRSWDFPTTVAKGLFEPLDGLIDLKDPLWKDYTISMEPLKWKGKYYVLGGVGGVNNFIWYNKTIFRDNGLDTPYQYYEKGKWDWDTFLNLAKELTQDRDGDGTTDQYGVGGGSLQFMLKSAIQQDFVKFDESGISNNLRNPELAKAENFLQDMNVKFQVIPQGDIGDISLFTSKKVAMFYFGTWLPAMSKDLLNMVKNGEVSFVPAPKAPDAKEPVYEAGIGGWSIAKGAKNIQGAIAYLAYSTYREKMNTSKTGNSAWLDSQIKDYYWNEEMVKSNKDANSPNTRRFPHVYHGIGNIASTWAWEPYGKVIQGIPWETIVEEYYPRMQAEVDKLNEETK